MEQQPSQVPQKHPVHAKRSSGGVTLTAIVGVLLLLGVAAGGAYVTVTYLAPDIVSDVENAVLPVDVEPETVPAPEPVSETEQVRDQFKNALENVLSFHSANRYYPHTLDEVMGTETLSSSITYEGEDEGTTFILCLTTGGGSACVSEEDFPERANLTQGRDVVEKQPAPSPTPVTTPQTPSPVSTPSSASVASTLNGVRSAMASYASGNDGSYKGGCSSITLSGVSCHDASAAYAAEMRQSNGTYYCVDSEGFAGTITTSKGSSLFCQ